ncbi:hypothetical protein PIB30_055307 [Stylosanthes scabra]|uniref:Uncharacterized protein n=1 Tax=Stylosanthes scabra TaxID=79078 RepID=A0ABU6ZHQ1_9FABA|nr:hypothetical protein [Stylosanthes scabra]
MKILMQHYSSSLIGDQIGGSPCWFPQQLLMENLHHFNWLLKRPIWTEVVVDCHTRHQVRNLVSLSRKLSDSIMTCSRFRFLAIISPALIASVSADNADAELTLDAVHVSNLPKLSLAIADIAPWDD